jgi:hypothetical protein
MDGGAGTKKSPRDPTGSRRDLGAPSGTAARRGFDGRPCGMGAPSGAAARRGFDGRPCEMQPHLARPYLLGGHNNQLEVGGIL